MEKDIKEILITEEEIKEKVKKIGSEIASSYKGKDLNMIGITTGSIVFFADLIRDIPIPLRVDTMSVSSYGGSTESSGSVKLLSELKLKIENKNVIIVDDIFDTGNTLNNLIKELSKFNPKDIKTCVLLEKQERHLVDMRPDFVCFDVPNEFVVGYGLDYNEKYRNLPYIGILKEEVFRKKVWFKIKLNIVNKYFTK